MGTFATVSVYAQDAGCMENTFRAMAFAERSLSSYDPDATVYRLNHERSVVPDAVLYDALLKAKRYYRQSGGRFDITIGSLTKGLFGFGEQERIPVPDAMQNAPVGMELVDFNATHVALAPGVLVDFGGFGKGYGVDMGMAAFKRCGGRHAVIALSGDIRCLGTCRLAIQDPFSDGTILSFMTKAGETGISTSGNYRRFVGDKSHNHLINPSTRSSERLFASVTLIGTVSSSDLDAWATAASVMERAEAVAFLKRRPVAYVLVFNDGTIAKSRNLTDFVRGLEAEHEND